MKNRDSDVRLWAVIPAAGIGTRMSADKPKQYLPLLSHCIIEHAIRPFLQNEKIKAVVVSIASHDRYWKHLSMSKHEKITEVKGGSTRSDSVLNALEYLVSVAQENDWVLVHDAARPCLTRDDLNYLIDSLSGHKVGGILATPVSDTIKQSDQQQCVEKTIDRTFLWRAYTPQMFRLGVLRDSILEAKKQGVVITDEASAMEFMGHCPKLISGRPDNIKITTPLDLPLAEYYLKQIINHNARC